MIGRLAFCLSTASRCRTAGFFKATLAAEEEGEKLKHLEQGLTNTYPLTLALAALVGLSLTRASVSSLR